MDDQLQMATTEELTIELLKRFETAFLVYCEYPKNDSKHRNTAAIEIRYHGSLTSAIGLSVLSLDMLKEISEHGPEDDEEV